VDSPRLRQAPVVQDHNPQRRESQVARVHSPRPRQAPADWVHNPLQLRDEGAVEAPQSTILWLEDQCGAVVTRLAAPVPLLEPAARRGDETGLHHSCGRARCNLPALSSVVLAETGTKSRTIKFKLKEEKNG
jgi:hypothetical protein